MDSNTDPVLSLSSRCTVLVHMLPIYVLELWQSVEVYASLSHGRPTFDQMPASQILLVNETLSHLASTFDNIFCLLITFNIANRIESVRFNDTLGLSKWMLLQHPNRFLLCIYHDYQNVMRTD
jgi:hypothetical protein